MSILTPLIASVLAQAATPAPPAVLHPPGIHQLPHGTTPRWWPLEDFWDPDVREQHLPSFGIDDEGTRYVVYAGGDQYCGWAPCRLYYQLSSSGRDWTRATRIPGTDDFGGGPQVVGAKGGRAYVAWFGSQGLEVTWTDDRGLSFAPPVAADPSLPGSLEVSMEIDSSGALHFAWVEAYNHNVYYLRSTPTYMPDASGAQSRDPVFLPGQRLYAEDGRVYSYPVMSIDGAGYVSIVYENKDGHIAFTHTYQGLSFPPSSDLGLGDYVQVTAAAEGPVTILFSAYNAAHTEFYLYSLVTFDGLTFDGPFQQTTREGELMPVRRSVRSGPDGAIYAIWYQVWPHTGNGMSLVYAQSGDYGVSFPRRDLVLDWHDYPGAAYPILAMTPDNIRCVVTQEQRYTEARW